MIDAKLITKNVDRIKYFSNKTTADGYRLWESKSHPAYRHFQKIKTKTK